MKKRLFSLLLVIAMMSILVFTGCSSSTTTETPAVTGSADTEKTTDDSTIVMRLAHINANTDPKQLEAEKFAELVKEKTNGRVKIEIYGGAVLGDVNEIIEGLSLGTNEIVIEGFGTIPDRTDLSLLDLVPFMYSDYDGFMNIWKGDVGEEILEVATDESGIKLFGASYRGARVVTSTKKFTNLGELKGLKIRVPSDNMSVSTWQALGTTPTPMAMTEVVTGIQQGTVEAQENPCILSYNFGLSDACKYLIKTNHRWSADVFMMDKNYFNNLDEDIQKAIIEAGEEASQYASKFILDNEDEYYSKWKADGVEIVEVDDISEFEDACTDIVDKDYPELSEWVNKIKAAQ